MSNKQNTRVELKITERNKYFLLVDNRNVICGIFSSEKAAEKALPVVKRKLEKNLDRNN